jgi:hypothetical protein
MLVVFVPRGLDDPAKLLIVTEFGEASSTPAGSSGR